MLSSRFSRTLERAGIKQKILWDRQHTRVIKFTWEECPLQLLPEDMAEAPSVVLKVWTAHRVQRDGGNLQASAELNCAIVGADEHGLLVTPLQYCISPDRGLFVLYPYAGVNLQEHFKMLRAVRPDMVLMHINRAAVHLLLGLDEVHSKNLVLRDLKTTNALYFASDGVYRLSDAGLCCTVGDNWYGGDDSRPSADHMRRYGAGRIRHSSKMLEETNTPLLDVLALAVMLYELATGSLPAAVDYDCRGDFTDRVPGRTVEELAAMEPMQRDSILLEAMFDRVADMVDNSWWDDCLREHIWPHDEDLALFLRRILRPREERASVDELLQDPYIMRVFHEERNRILDALPAWHARIAASRQVAEVVKFAQQAEAMQRCGCEVSLAGSVDTAAEPVSTSVGSTNTSTTNTTSDDVQPHSQLQAASQHTPLPDEPLLTSASSKAGSDDCGSRCSTSNSQQLSVQAMPGLADQHPADQHCWQLEHAPANNSSNTISILPKDGRCSSSSGSSTDGAATEQAPVREGTDAVVIVMVNQHMSHQASDDLKQQQADTVLQGLNPNEQQLQAMGPEADEHAMLQLWQQQVWVAEAAAAAAHTALQAYQQQLLQLAPEAGAMKPQDTLQAEQQCWVQRTVGGPVSHPIVLDDDEDQWVWTEQSTQLVFCKTQLQTAVALIDRLLSAGC